MTRGSTLWVVRRYSKRSVAHEVAHDTPSHTLSTRMFAEAQKQNLPGQPNEVCSGLTHSPDLSQGAKLRHAVAACHVLAIHAHVFQPNKLAKRGVR